MDYKEIELKKWWNLQTDMDMLIYSFFFTIANHIKDQELKSFREIVRSGDKDHELAAIKEELETLYDNPLDFSWKTKI